MQGHWKSLNKENSGSWKHRLSIQGHRCRRKENRVKDHTLGNIQIYRAEEKGQIGVEEKEGNDSYLISQCTKIFYKRALVLTVANTMKGQE